MNKRPRLWSWVILSLFLLAYNIVLASTWTLGPLRITLNVLSPGDIVSAVLWSGNALLFSWFLEGSK